MEHVLTIQSPLVTVTAYKSNGKPNATMQSWCTFVGEGGYYVLFGSVNIHRHMYACLKEKKCCVINIPSMDVLPLCMKTIENNDFEQNEITDSDLTAVHGEKVDAPLIEECMVNLECELMWEHELSPDGSHAVMCLRMVNAIMDEQLFCEDISGRYGENGYLYNIHSPMNPLTGKAYSTSIGALQKRNTNE